MEGLRPLGVGELLDASIRIYKSRAKTLLAAVAIPVIPVVIFTTLITWSSQPSQQTDPATGLPTLDGGDLGLMFAGFIVTLLFTVVASSVATAACYRSISGAYVGDDPDWRESLRFGLSRIWPVLALSFVTSLLTGFGLIFCLVGAMVPYTFFSVAMPVLLVEGQGVFASIRRSCALVRGTAWRVLGIVLLGYLLAAAFQAAIGAPVAALVFAGVSPVARQVGTAFFSIISTVLVTPFTAAYGMALYVDLRVRKEGFDLVLWAQRLGTQPAGGVFPAQPGAPAVSPGWPGPPPGYGPPPGNGPPPGYGPPSAYGHLPPPPLPPAGYGPPPAPIVGPPTAWAPPPPGRIDD